MRPLLTLALIGGLACGFAFLAKGKTDTAQPSASLPAGTKPVDNPKEKLDEERLDAAMKGLVVARGRLTSTVRGSNRAAAIKANEAADTSLNKENTWFKAAGLFRDAILLDPTYARPYEGFARSMLLEGNVQLAETALRTAVSLDPAFQQARFELGTVIQMRGDYAGCVDMWSQLVKINPSYPDLYARMAVASYFAQDYKASWTYLGEADKRHQNVPPQFRPLLKEVAPRP